MKGKRVIAGILLAGILAVTMVGCKNTDNTKEETEKPVITRRYTILIQIIVWWIVVASEGNNRLFCFFFRVICVFTPYHGDC